MRAGRIMVLTAVLMLFGTWSYAADCASGGRYEVNGSPTPNGTVTDCRTGLIWLRNANCIDESNGIANPTGKLSWRDAMKWVKGLRDGLCGLSDGSWEGYWRLPTITEWMAMVQYAKGRYIGPALTNGTGTGQWTSDNVFHDVQSDVYWSCTPDPTHQGGPYVWVMQMRDGTNAYTNMSYPRGVWPVRAGQSATFDSVTIE